MTLSEDSVRHTALLARLGLEDVEVKKMQIDLSAILDFFQALEKYADTPEAFPALEYQTGGTGVRGDQAQVCNEDTRANIVKNFPVAKDTFLKVRSVF